MDIQTVTVYGTGLIGASWATIFSLKGKNVRLFDIKASALADAKAKIRDNLLFLCHEQIITQKQMDDALLRITETTESSQALLGTDFVQENGPENIQIKQDIIENIEKFVDYDTVIASSTSGLLISDIAAQASHPDRVIGAHPYNPPHLIPLVELSHIPGTSDAYILRAKDFYESVNRVPIVMKKELNGFIGNRLQSAISRECLEILNRDACSVEDLDKAMVYGPGLRWALIGPMIISELAAAPYGMKVALQHLGPSVEKINADLANWVTPPKYTETDVDALVNGVHEEIAARDEYYGNTVEGLERFRNRGLIQLLRFHKKL